VKVQKQQAWAMFFRSVTALLLINPKNKVGLLQGRYKHSLLIFVCLRFQLLHGVNSYSDEDYLRIYLIRDLVSVIDRF
jgi:hypothetical protein